MDTQVAIKRQRGGGALGRCWRGRMRLVVRDFENDYNIYVTQLSCANTAAWYLVFLNPTANVEWARGWRTGWGAPLGRCWRGWMRLVVRDSENEYNI